MKKQKIIFWSMIVTVMIIWISPAYSQLKDGNFDQESAKTSWAGYWIDLNGCIKKDEPRFDSTSSTSPPYSARFSFREVGGICLPSAQHGALYQILEKPVTAKGLRLNVRISRGELDWLEAKGSLEIKINNIDPDPGESVQSFSNSNYEENEPWKLREIIFTENKVINKLSFIFSVFPTQPTGSELIFLIDDVSIIKASIVTNPPEGTINQTNYDLIIDNSEIDTYDYVLVDKDNQIIDSRTGVAATEHIQFTLPSDGSRDGLLKLTVTGKKDGNTVGEPTVVEWTLDTTPPTATITGVPTSPTSDIKVTATIGGEGVVAYKYKFDTDPYSAEIDIGQPTVTKDCFKSGEHTLTVIGKDAVGNWQTEDNATKVTWTIAANPRAVIESFTPTSTPTYSTSASIRIGGTGITHYRYRLDSGTFGTTVYSVGTLNLANLSVGSHTIYIIGRDCGGNWQAESQATSRTWTILAVIKGDIDNSGKVDLNDMILALKILVGLPAQNPFLSASVDGQQIRLHDVIYILQYIAEKRS